MGGLGIGPKSSEFNSAQPTISPALPLIKEHLPSIDSAETVAGEVSVEQLETKRQQKGQQAQVINNKLVINDPTGGTAPGKSVEDTANAGINSKSGVATSDLTGVGKEPIDELITLLNDFGKHASALKELLEEIIKTQQANIDSVNLLFRMANALTEKMQVLARELERAGANKNLMASMTQATMAIVTGVVAAGMSVIKTSQYVSKTNALHKNKMGAVEARDDSMLKASATTGGGNAESNRALMMSAANKNAREIAKIDHELQISASKFQNDQAVIAAMRTVGEALSQLAKATITREAQEKEILSKEAAHALQVTQKQVDEALKTITQLMQDLVKNVMQIQSSQEKLTANIR